MSPEDKIKIESLRAATSSGDLNYLKTIYRNETGKSLSGGCLCKSANVIKVRNEFYNWYDSLTPNAQTDEL